MEDFLSNCRQMNRSPFTLINYKADLEKFLDWYECIRPGRPLHKVDSDVISSYSAWMSGEAGDTSDAVSYLSLLESNISFKRFSAFSTPFQ